MIEIHFDNDQTVDLLSKVLHKYGIEDGILVLAELAQPRSQLKGLDMALQLVNDGRPMIVLTFMDYLDKGQLIEDARYHALRGYPHVQFLRLPVGGAEVVAVFTNPVSRPADPLAIALIGVKDPGELMGLLKHDLKGLADEPRVLERARIAGYEGSDEAILTAVRTSQPTALRPFAGQSFPDLFCDIEGTLLVDGALNQRIVDYLKEQSATRPITLWTGGDARTYRKQLAKKLPWKVVSKWLFGGATIATAIDDQSKDWLEQTYDMTIGQHLPPDL